jgi:hypothetical protein
MKIRHCVEKSNIEAKSLLIIDPLQIRHAVINSRKISALSGAIDPKSHLNLDYPVHLVDNCIICEKFELGSTIDISDDGFVYAKVRPDSYQHYGKYDYTKNLLNMIESVKNLRGINPQINTNTNAYETKTSSINSSDDVHNSN